MTKKFSIVQKLDWDSKFFGISIARLNQQRLSPRLMDAVLRFCKTKKIGCLFYRAAINDPASVELAEKHGFHFTNFRMTYQFNFDLGHTFPQIKPNDFVFRPARSADLKQLMHISKNLYLDSRYYYDRNFSKGLCDRFYSEWIRGLATSRNKNKGVYVLAHNQAIVGYVGFEIVHDLVNLVLVGVSSRCQGRGAGKILLGQFLKKMFKDGFVKFEVVTQGRNIASQRLYQAGGFKITGSHIDYHKWF